MNAYIRIYATALAYYQITHKCAGVQMCRKLGTNECVSWIMCMELCHALAAE